MKTIKNYCLKNVIVEQVISKLKKLRSKNTQASEAKDIAIRYYVEHADRMMYKTFKNQGLLIGSGPIEAGHRIQQRLKLSGQKSIKGANAIANLTIKVMLGLLLKIWLG